MIWTKRTRKRPSWRQFTRDERGSSLVEYSLVVGPFLLMMFGIIETWMSYTTTIQLERGLEIVARRVRTGEVRMANMTAGQFKNMLCTEVSPIIPCDANLYVDVREFVDFASVMQTPPLDANGKINGNFSFQTGAPGSTILARAFYVMHLNFPDVSMSLSNMAGSDRLVAAAQVFRNEP